MRVVYTARNYMPMHVRRQIAETREVDFVRFHHAAQRLLDGEYHAHAMLALRAVQIGHFPDMGLPNHAAVAGMVGILDQHHAAPLVAPQQVSARPCAEFAITHGGRA